MGKICVLFNTKDGCQKKGTCLYGHELVGKDASKAVLDYARVQKDRKKAEGGGSPKKEKGGGKGGKRSKNEDASRSGNANERYKSPLPKSSNKCKWWHGTERGSVKGMCKYGDACSLQHGPME